MDALVDLVEVDLQREDLAGQNPPAVTAAGHQALGAPLGRSRRTRCRTRIELRSPGNLLLQDRWTRPDFLSDAILLPHAKRMAQAYHPRNRLILAYDEWIRRYLEGRDRKSTRLN